MNKNLFKGFNFDEEDNVYYDGDCFDEEHGNYPINEDWKTFIVGHSIVDIYGDKDGEYLTLILDNGVKLIAESNEGCGGCGNGWFLCDYEDVLTLGLKGNVITNMEVNCDCAGDWGTFSLYIYTLDKRLDVDFNGGDNGYYGIGIKLFIEIPMDAINKMCNE